MKTVDVLSFRNIYIQDSTCIFCQETTENLFHLMFECDFSFKVLTNLIPSFQNFFLRPTIFQAIDHIGGLSVADNMKHSLLLILNATVYFIWLERNSRRFKSNTVCATTLSSKISRAIYLRITRWKNGEYLKDKLNMKYR
ncbi:hypothetical protein M5K25_005661 [Dendrobium thyrsiflorum]|uniref:Reverse transcriptase zinc-binding domain-containing protein n=1 Tax=Dendrobium thyrsiflorum TaxID=117978 RepID=A0ABD0VJM4_DENTH